MHNNTNYQCKICWNKALTFGVGSIQLGVGSIQLSFRIHHCVHPIHAFNPNVTTFQSNCAEGLHFSAFILTSKDKITEFFQQKHKVSCKIK